MSDVGAGASGKTLIGAGTGTQPVYASIGTNSGLTAHGTVISQNNGAFTAASPSTSSFVLTSNGASADPTFQTPGTIITQSNAYWYYNSAVTNATGDGTTFTFNYDTVRFQTGTDITMSAGTFTCNTSGVYLINWFLSFSNLGSGHTQLAANFNPSGANTGAPGLDANPFAMSNPTVTQSSHFASALVSLGATSTFTLSAAITGSTKTVTIPGNTGSTNFNDCNYFTYVRLA